MDEPGVEQARPPRLLAPLGALFVLAALVAIGVASRGVWAEWAQLDAALEGFTWRVRPAWLVGATLSAVVALLVTGTLWTDLFRRAGGRMGTREGVAAWLGSNLGRYLPGKVWQLTGIAAYARARGEPGAAAFVVSLALQAVMLATGAVVGFGLVGDTAFERVSPWALAVGGLVAVAALSPPSLRALMAIGRRLLKEPGEDPTTELTTGGLVRAGLIGLVVWGLYGAGFWAVIEGLLDPNPVSLSAAIGVFAAGYIAGYIVLLAPGGVVVREGAIAGLLGVVAGIPFGPAAALAIAARAWTTSAELIAFALALGVGLRRGPTDR